MRAIPTIAQLYDARLNDLQVEFGFPVSRWGKAWMRALAAACAAGDKIHYLRMGDVQKNVFITTADPVAKGGTLEIWGEGKLGRPPFPARAGRYVVTVTGSTGGAIKALTTFKSDDSSTSPGYLFQVLGAYTMPGSSGSVTLRALVAGSVSELKVGDTLTATKPMIGVNPQATVTSVTVTPVAAEDIEVYRKKALDAWRLEPQGGARTDYRWWGLDVEGVANIYPYAYSGHANEAIIYVEATKDASTDDHGTPPSDMLDDVEAVIEFDPDTSLPTAERGRRPMTVFMVNVEPVTPLEVNITFTGTAGTIPADDQVIITAALGEAIDKIRPFIAGCDLLADKNDVLSVFKMVQVVLNAVPGSIFTGIDIEVDGSPETEYTFTLGEIPYLGTVTYP